MGSVLKRIMGTNHELPDSVKGIEAKFRTLFARGVGTAVLAAMLEQLGFFDPIKLNDPEAIARHNYAVELLKWCKVILTDDGRVSNVQSLTDRLMGANGRTGR